MGAGDRIDTTVIAEWRLRMPKPRVLQGCEQRPASQLHLSVRSQGELRRAVERLGEGERQRALRSWLAQERPALVAGRVLPMDGSGLPTAVANPWDHVEGCPP
jgi:hypothetical protein